MKQIPRSQFTQLSMDEVMKILPVVLTYNSEPMALVVKPEDFIYLGDMHPRVKHMLKAMEARARVGMPKNDEALDAQELKLMFIKEKHDARVAKDEERARQFDIAQQES